ncbi:MAG: UbiA family prenyltransferase [Myxococcota bacterium]
MSPARALIRLARLRLLPFVLMLVFLGFAWAHWDRALPLRGGARLPWILAGWAALHAGTLWLNAALDRDEGEVLFGRPVRPPPVTAAAGYVALAAAIPLAWWGDPVAGASCAICVALAIAYSHPRLAWKGHPLAGPVVNVVGYGLLSPLAGWSAVDVPPNPRTVVVWALCGFAILGTYVAAQAFQQAEDRSRGYRTLVATRGPRAVLTVARTSIAIALFGGLALAAIGWLPRLCLFGIAGWWLVDRHLAEWASRPDGGTEADARRFTVLMLGAATFGIALALTQYTVDSLARRPVAGLGTAAGLPSDRTFGQPFETPRPNPSVRE